MFGVCLSSTGKCNVWSLFNFNSKEIRTMSEICSKLIERHI